MSGTHGLRSALVIEASPRWRAAVAEALREGGWTVTALAAPPEGPGLVPFQLAILEVGSPAATAAALSLLERWIDTETRCLLLSSLPEVEVPPELTHHPQVLGMLGKRSFQAEALLELVEALGTRAAPAAAPNGELKVLVVEDDVHWRAIYEELLAEAGYAPYFAVSYGEARGWLQRVDFAITLVDLNLASSAAPAGNRDGFHLLRAAKQRRVPAIVVSALGDPADIDRAYDEFGIFAFVEKEGFDRRNFLRLMSEAWRPPAGEESDAVAAAAPAPGIDQLTPREHDVLHLLIQGYTNRQIAEALLITPNTTKKHVDHILQKLGVSTRAGAVAAAMRAGDQAWGGGFSPFVGGPSS